MVSQGVGMRRQKIAPDFKLMAVLEDLKGYSSLGDICRKYQIGESLYLR